MASYQLFKINENFNLKKLQEEDIIKTAKVNKDDPQTMKTLLDSLKKSYRNLYFEPLKYDFAIKMSMDEHLQFQDKQTLWIKREKNIIKHNQLLLVGKADRKIEKLIMIYLRDLADLSPIVFQKKQLWVLWKNIKKLKNADVKLHRVILKKTFLEADKINEINIHANDLGELGVLEDIIKQTEQVFAITVKIIGYYKESKWVTIRIDKNGSILIYGKHDINIISEFLDLFARSIR